MNIPGKDYNKEKESYIGSVACLVLGAIIFLVAFFAHLTWLYFGCAFFMLLGIIDMIRVAICNSRIDNKNDTEK